MIQQAIRSISAGKTSGKTVLTLSDLESGPEKEIRRESAGKAKGGFGREEFAGKVEKEARRDSAGKGRSGAHGPIGTMEDFAGADAGADCCSNAGVDARVGANAGADARVGAIAGLGSRAGAGATFDEIMGFIQLKGGGSVVVTTRKVLFRLPSTFAITLRVFSATSLTLFSPSLLSLPFSSWR